MAFKSINDVDRKSKIKTFINFQPNTGVMRISLGMLEISTKWDVQFDVSENIVRLRPSENGFQFKAYGNGCHKAFVKTLGLDDKKKSIRFDLYLHSDGWFYSIAE